MRRRSATAVTILAGAASAAALVLVPAAPASAANGVLTLDGTAHADPIGCHLLDRESYRVSNDTDEPVFILTGNDCTGEVMGVLLPGESDHGAGAGSIFVPGRTGRAGAT